MEATRAVVDAERLANIIDLPESLKKRKVEVIVLPVGDDATAQPGKSMKGYLKTYANPDLIGQEKKAWEKAVAEKHAGI